GATRSRQALTFQTTGKSPCCADTFLRTSIRSRKPAGQSYLERSQSFNERLATNMTDNSNMTPQQRDGESKVSLSKCLRDFTEEVANLKEAGGETLSDTLANWATAHYVAAAKSAARNA